MHCEQFEARWQRLLDERRSPAVDPHLLAHSMTCEACASMLDAGEAMLIGLGEDCPELRDDFAERVVTLASSSAIAPGTNSPSKIRSHNMAGPPSRGRLGRSWAFAAPAAGIALAVMIAVFNYVQFRGQTPRTEISRFEQSAPTSAIGIAPEKDLQLAGISGESTTPDLQALLLELAERFPKDEAAKALSTHMQKLDSAARPLARSFGTAFTAIYRSVGKGQSSNKSAQALAISPNVA